MITVCYLSRNYPRHLANSLDTVGQQTMRPSKIIVIDCSDNVDDIKTVMEQFQDKHDIPCEIQWRPVSELSRSQGRHLGRQYVETPLMISTECDTLWPRTILEKSMEYFHDLTKKIFLQPHIATCDKNGQIEAVYKNHQSGFYQMFRVDDFDAIGGYNPFLQGWGYEDADFRKRIIAHGCKQIVIPLVVKHQWHAKASTADRIIAGKVNQQIAESTYWNGIKWGRRA